MKLITKEKIKHEIIHFYDSLNKNQISSNGKVFSILVGGVSYVCKLPNYNPFIFFRLTRRFLRLDKSNAFFNHKKDAVIIIFRGKIYKFTLQNQDLNIIAKLKQCRCVLHNSIAISKDFIIFGEYGRNSKRSNVPIWISEDDGNSFKIVHELGGIKHIHGIYEDPYSSSLWITTGDNNGECFLMEVPKVDFSAIKIYGDGSQKWRTVSLMFKEDKICWIMDSPNEIAKLQVFDREKKNISEGQSFDAPVWYTKRLSDNSYLAQTSIEPGNAVKSKYSKIFYSTDLINWHQIASFKKDLLPKILFKFGVVFFSEGHQTKDDFTISGEALFGLDGSSWNCSIKES